MRNRKLNNLTKKKNTQSNIGNLFISIETDGLNSAENNIIELNCKAYKGDTLIGEYKSGVINTSSFQFDNSYMANKISNREIISSKKTNINCTAEFLKFVLLLKKKYNINRFFISCWKYSFTIEFLRKTIDDFVKKCGFNLFFNEIFMPLGIDVSSLVSNYIINNRENKIYTLRNFTLDSICKYFNIKEDVKIDKVIKIYKMVR